VSGDAARAALVAEIHAQLARAKLVPKEPLPAAPDSAALAARCAADPRALAAVIDHTLLRADVVRADIRRHCEEANHHGFAAVCVNSMWVLGCASHVAAPVRVAAVAGFPLGANDPGVKVAEAGFAIAMGAHEVDMVLPIGYLREGFPPGGPIEAVLLELLMEDVRGVVFAVREAEGPAPVGERRVKVILETPLLDERQKIAGALLAVAAGADFVKTCTGFAGPATVEDVALLRATVGGAAGVKASGGIRDRDTALALLAAGANRLGCSASLAVLGA
jgi:deoxyribose-phosphate aldolase